MIKPIDPKIAIGIAAFLGITSLGTLISQLQRFGGWAAGPSILAAQAQGLDSLRAWHQAEARTQAEMAEKVDTIASRQKGVLRLLSEMPEAKAAAKRLRQREKEREEIFGPRSSLAADRFQSLKGEAIR